MATSMSNLAQMISQLTTSPGLGGGILEGQKTRRDIEDRDLTREQLIRKMEMEEEMFPFKLSQAQRQATAVDQPKYARTFDTEGNLVYVPEQPGAAPMIRTDLKGMKTPEAEAQQIKFNQENYKYYVDKSRANAKSFGAASRILPALKDSLEKGEQATGLAKQAKDMAYSVFRTLGADPKKTIDLLNMNPTNRALIDSGVAEMAVGELAAFGAQTTDFEYMKAADIVGPTATADEVLLAVMQARLEPMVEWQKQFNQAREKYGDDYGSISEHMLNYEATNPLAAYETEVSKEITPKADYITVDEAWEKSKNIARTLGSGAEQLFNEMYGALTPKDRIGETVLKDHQTGKTYTFQDGVLIGVE